MYHIYVAECECMVSISFIFFCIHMYSDNSTTLSKAIMVSKHDSVLSSLSEPALGPRLELPSAERVDDWAAQAANTQRADELKDAFTSPWRPEEDRRLQAAGQGVEDGQRCEA